MKNTPSEISSILKKMVKLENNQQASLDLTKFEEADFSSIHKHLLETIYVLKEEEENNEFSIRVNCFIKSKIPNPDDTDNYENDKKEFYNEIEILQKLVGEIENIEGVQVSLEPWRNADDKKEVINLDRNVGNLFLQIALREMITNFELPNSNAIKIAASLLEAIRVIVEQTAEKGSVNDINKILLFQIINSNHDFFSIVNRLFFPSTRVDYKERIDSYRKDKNSIRIIDGEAYIGYIIGEKFIGSNINGKIYLEQPDSDHSQIIFQKNNFHILTQENLEISKIKTFDVSGNLLYNGKRLMLTPNGFGIKTPNKDLTQIGVFENGIFKKGIEVSTVDGETIYVIGDFNEYEYVEQGVEGCKTDFKVTFPAQKNELPRYVMISFSDLKTSLVSPNGEKIKISLEELDPAVFNSIQGEFEKQTTLFNKYTSNLEEILDPRLIEELRKNNEMIEKIKAFLEKHDKQISAKKTQFQELNQEVDAVYTKLNKLFETEKETRKTLGNLLKKAKKKKLPLEDIKAIEKKKEQFEKTVTKHKKIKEKNNEENPKKMTLKSLREIVDELPALKEELVNILAGYEEIIKWTENTAEFVENSVGSRKKPATPASNSATTTKESIMPPDDETESTDKTPSTSSEEQEEEHESSQSTTQENKPPRSPATDTKLARRQANNKKRKALKKEEKKNTYKPSEVKFSKIGAPSQGNQNTKETTAQTLSPLASKNSKALDENHKNFEIPVNLKKKALISGAPLTGPDSEYEAYMESKAEKIRNRLMS